MIQSPTPLPKLALFDLDGTLISADSMVEFIRFTCGSGALYKSYLLLSPMLFMYKAGFIKNDEAKLRLLNWHFKGWGKEKLESLGRDFCREKLPSFFRPTALKRLNWHKENGDTISVVTSSLYWWVQPWCENQGIHCIATLPAFENQQFSGHLATPNCYGEEKQKRVYEKFSRDAFSEVWAYGDTQGDTEMLDSSDMWFWKPFQ